MGAGGMSTNAAKPEPVPETVEPMMPAGVAESKICTVEPAGNNSGDHWQPSPERQEFQERQPSQQQCRDALLEKEVPPAHQSEAHPDLGPRNMWGGSNDDDNFVSDDPLVF